MLSDVNKLFIFKSLLTTPCNVLPLHLKQIFPPIMWIFAEVKGDEIEPRLTFKIFSSLTSIQKFENPYHLTWKRRNICEDTLFYLSKSYLWNGFLNNNERIGSFSIKRKMIIIGIRNSIWSLPFQFSAATLLPILLTLKLQYKN